MPGPASIVLETSVPTASLLVAEQGVVTAQRSFTSDRNHNAALFNPLQELLERVPLTEIGTVIVGSGPGSYSGTRVGIAAAQGIAIAANCPAWAIPSLVGMPSAAQGKKCRVVGDARRGSGWSALVEDYRVVEAPAICTSEELAGRIAQDLNAGVPVVCVEDPSRLGFEAELTGKILQELPTAHLLWEAWQATSETERTRWQAEPPQPMYLRPPLITESKKKPLIGR